MKSLFSLIAFMTIFLIGTVQSSVGQAPDTTKSMAEADQLFQDGYFDQARTAYADVFSQDANNWRAAARLGYIALLGNQLETAQTWLKKADALKPNFAPIQALQAETEMRQDHFAQAAPLMRVIGEEAKAKQLESFGAAIPYHLDPAFKTATVKFVQTDLLPVVQVGINGHAPVNFFIDTGAADLTLDTDYAKEIGIQSLGGEKGTFAGGKQAAVGYGEADTLTLGNLTVKNVPVDLIQVRAMSGPVFGGLPINGVIGTVFLSHFLSTLDYPKGQLILQPKGSDGTASGAISVPFWMAGDHYIVARGAINSSPSQLFFVDTGLAGGGFSASAATLKAAGIGLDTKEAAKGFGGGGTVQVTPFVVKTLSLGPAVGHDIQGLSTGPLPVEDVFGFRLNGLISHGFFRPVALTLDFSKMQLRMQKG